MNRCSRNGIPQNISGLFDSTVFGDQGVSPGQATKFPYWEVTTTILQTCEKNFAGKNYKTFFKPSQQARDFVVEQE